MSRSENEWHKLLADCKTRPKGTRVADWCHQQNINVNTYKYWQRKLKHKGPEDEVCFVPLALPVPQRSSNSNTRPSEISIRYQEYEISVTQQCSQSLLSTVLSTVRATC